jgi:hypothetical protein
MATEGNKKKKPFEQILKEQKVFGVKINVLFMSRQQKKKCLLE